jgi:trehalose 6-phosphate synthase
VTGRLVVLSNRVAPLTGRQAASAGGLAVGVHAALSASGGVWFGWSGQIVKGALPGPQIRRAGRITYVLTDLTEAEHAGYYAGFANRALWPLLHYRVDLAHFDRADHDMWRKVNARFAAELLPLLEPGDRVWAHDYHLIPLGAELRAGGFDGRLGFFLHIPFPPLELFVTLPWHRELGEDLAACDVIGFQTASDARHFREYAVSELEGRALTPQTLSIDRRRCRVDAFPIGIDVDEVMRMAVAPEAQQQARQLSGTLDARALLIGVDRLDYSKGIVERLRAFELLLREREGWAGKVTFVQISAPSREDLPEYQSLRRSIERLAGHINGRLGDASWTPVRYVNRAYARRTLAAFFRIARVGVVTPLRDGMNLVACEFVAAQDPADPGALVLSRFAGAAELMEGALILNPYDVHGAAAALDRALRMSLEERRERHTRMLAAVRRHDVTHWRDSYLAALEDEAGALVAS